MFSRLLLSGCRCSQKGNQAAAILKHFSGSVSVSNSIGGFSTQLYGLLKDGPVEQREGLSCSVESLSTSRNALVSGMGLSSEGVAPETVAGNLRQHYQSLLGEDERAAFFSVLALHLSVDHNKVADKAQQLTTLHSQKRNEVALLKCEAGLRHSLSPFYCQLFNVIARLEGGIKFLVDMRGDLLDLLKGLQEAGSPTHLLTEMNHHLREVLTQWFTPQLLDVRPITWQSPCDLLEKVSLYEAVHPLRHWKDLKHRLGANRRCFAFMHRAIPHEPIVILHAALTTEPSSCIQTLLDRSLHQDLENVSTANFYSISATQKGLSGVELGNFLIRRVVHELQREFPQQLTTFVTLSPIPGFRKWLDTHLKMNAEEGLQLRELEPLLPLFPGSTTPTQALISALQEPSQWIQKGNEELTELLKPSLTKLCARYLAVVKRRGHAMDPVAHFHLQNGASVWRLNWMADKSPNGMRRSYGLMVNYRYNLLDISRNSDLYRIKGQVALSDLVKTWVD